MRDGCYANPDLPDTGVVCCIGVAVYGHKRCTCWEPVYDGQDQAEPRPEVVQQTRSRMCHDCAFRPGSPERSGDPKSASDEDDLRDLVDRDLPFNCHQGMRRPTHYVHPPTGTTIPASPLDYDPPRVGVVSFKLDGTPTDLCAGWAAHRRALLAAGGAT